MKELVKKEIPAVIGFILTCLLVMGCMEKTRQEYVLTETDLVPEGIAYSVNTDAFYLSSVARSKIIAVDRTSGRQYDFIGEGGSGYTPGAGIYVDDHRNLLHAIGGYYMFRDSLTSLFTFDLRSAKLLKRYDVKDAGEHYLNDLVVDQQGNIYLTDTKAAAVYILRKDHDSLELFYSSPEIEFPNGIAISDDQTKLYIASFFHGVRVLDLDSKKLLNHRDTLGLSQGIDGLEFYRNHLFAVQNGVAANGYNFRKLVLNQTQDKVIDVEVIDSQKANLDVPLTFCLQGDRAVVIGNSNLQYLDQETFLFKGTDTLRPTRLLIYPLR